MTHPTHFNLNQNQVNKNEYKGMFYNENKEKAYHEAGAHFAYRDLVQKLRALASILSPDRVSKPEPHQKTKSFTIERISLNANKNLQSNKPREYDSLERKKTRSNKAKKIMLKTIVTEKEEGLPSIAKINTEIAPVPNANQLKPMAKLNPIPLNKEKKQFPIIKPVKERYSSRNTGKLLIPKNNTVVNPYMSIEVLGQQLTERKIGRIRYKAKALNQM